MNGILMVLLVAVAFMGCSQKDDGVTIPSKDSAFVAAPAVASTMPPSAAPVVSPAKVAKKVAKAVAKVAKAPAAADKNEKAAYDRAAESAARVACLRYVVNKKLDYDVSSGEFHDFGNVLTSPACDNYKVTTKVAEATFRGVHESVGVRLIPVMVKTGGVLISDPWQVGVLYKN